MPSSSLPASAGLIISEFKARATVMTDTPVIQPAAPFLDMTGEALRRRIFMTESETGESLCLRPEFTIPVCMGHIAENAGTPRRYAYCGMVFRQARDDGEAEFYQAGIEDLGEADVAAADARAIADATQVLQKMLPGRKLLTTLGDQAVFEAVVRALGLPGGWQKRLIGAFGNQAQLARLMETLASPQPVSGLDRRVAGFLADGNEAGLIAHINETMSATGYSTNASRSPEEIARRLKEKLALSVTSLDEEALAALKAFLALDVALDKATKVLDDFAAEYRLDIKAAVSGFSARIEALSSAGVDVATISYRAAFGRPLDYYTGLVFEISEEGPSGALLAGGGRYDRLLTLLGAEARIPAVGFSLWLDRIERATAQAEGRTSK
ncbi:ATP phosphoribosyltransferase regulatory subunit [Martelella mediterranea]|uniref:ATP phosphoribosyltransferase regulatory subunit n=1 Tax=Martelella mediterranea TaxID=293089 RepID=A0A4R3NRB0_9HYPH|nr:ATP phosphoribosyltransferase regulatory subunit [Martelella mediterranea]TCT38827.1 ATP phosphoribosyltransferase regulatory subunit [Martelella mediterranea]